LLLRLVLGGVKDAQVDVLPAQRANIAHADDWTLV